MSERRRINEQDGTARGELRYLLLLLLLSKGAHLRSFRLHYISYHNKKGLVAQHLTIPVPRWYKTE